MVSLLSTQFRDRLHQHIEAGTEDVFTPVCALRAPRASPEHPIIFNS